MTTFITAFLWAIGLSFGAIVASIVGFLLLILLEALIDSLQDWKWRRDQAWMAVEAKKHVERGHPKPTVFRDEGPSSTPLGGGW